MQGSKPYHLLVRTIAAVVVLCFSFTTVVESAPPELSSLITAQRDPSPGELNFPRLIKKIEIPKSMGRIDNRYVSTGPTVLHVEDAHDNYESQLNTEKILQYLAEEHGVDLLLVEGAVGTLSGERLQFFADPKLARQAANHLAEEGLLGGLELFMLDQWLANGRHPERSQQPQDRLREGSVIDSSATGLRMTSAFGIEDGRLYRENLEAFRRVMKAHEQSETFLERLKSAILWQGSHAFSRALKDFFREWLFYEYTDSELLGQVRTLRDYAQDTLELNLADARNQIEWPQLVRLTKIQKLETQLDLERANTEKQKLVEWAEINLPMSFPRKRESILCLQEFTNDCRRKYTPRKFYESFLETVEPLGFTFDDYEHVSVEIGLFILQSELSAIDLFTEIDTLTDLILTQLAKSEEEQALIELYRKYKLLKSLLSLELIPPTYREVIDLQDALLPSRMMKNMLSLRGDHPTAVIAKPQQPMIGLKQSPDLPAGHAGITSTRSDTLSRNDKDSSALDVIYADALQFYAGALKREDAIYENVHAKLKETGKESAILITGGFHVPGLSEQFKSNQFSYLTISPNISKVTDRGNYLDIMTLQGHFPALRSYARPISLGMSRAEVRNTLGLKTEAYYALRLNRALEQFGFDRGMSRSEFHAALAPNPWLQPRAEVRQSASVVEVIKERILKEPIRGRGQFELVTQRALLKLGESLADLIKFTESNLMDAEFTYDQLEHIKFVLGTFGIRLEGDTETPISDYLTSESVVKIGLKPLSFLELEQNTAKSLAAISIASVFELLLWTKQRLKHNVGGFAKEESVQFRDLLAKLERKGLKLREDWPAASRKGSKDPYGQQSWWALIKLDQELPAFLKKKVTVRALKIVRMVQREGKKNVVIQKRITGYVVGTISKIEEQRTGIGGKQWRCISFSNIDIDMTTPEFRDDVNDGVLTVGYHEGKYIVVGIVPHTEVHTQTSAPKAEVRLDPADPIVRRGGEKTDPPSLDLDAFVVSLERFQKYGIKIDKARVAVRPFKHEQENWKTNAQVVISEGPIDRSSVKRSVDFQLFGERDGVSPIEADLTIYVDDADPHFVRTLTSGHIYVGSESLGGANRELLALALDQLQRDGFERVEVTMTDYRRDGEAAEFWTDFLNLRERRGEDFQFEEDATPQLKANLDCWWVGGDTLVFNLQNFDFQALLRAAQTRYWRARLHDPNHKWTVSELKALTDLIHGETSNEAILDLMIAYSEGVEALVGEIDAVFTATDSVAIRGSLKLQRHFNGESEIQAQLTTLTTDLKTMEHEHFSRDQLYKKFCSITDTHIKLYGHIFVILSRASDSLKALATENNSFMTDNFSPPFESLIRVQQLSSHLDTFFLEFLPESTQGRAASATNFVFTGDSEPIEAAGSMQQASLTGPQHPKAFGEIELYRLDYFFEYMEGALSSGIDGIISNHDVFEPRFDWPEASDRHIYVTENLVRWFFEAIKNGLYELPLVDGMRDGVLIIQGDVRGDQLLLSVLNERKGDFYLDDLDLFVPFLSKRSLKRAQELEQLNLPSRGTGLVTLRTIARIHQGAFGLDPSKTRDSEVGTPVTAFTLTLPLIPRAEVRSKEKLSPLARQVLVPLLVDTPGFNLSHRRDALKFLFSVLGATFKDIPEGLVARAETLEQMVSVEALNNDGTELLGKWMQAIEESRYEELREAISGSPLALNFLANRLRTQDFLLPNGQWNSAKLPDAARLDLSKISLKDELHDQEQAKRHDDAKKRIDAIDTATQFRKMAATIALIMFTLANITILWVRGGAIRFFVFTLLGVIFWIGTFIGSDLIALARNRKDNNTLRELRESNRARQAVSRLNKDDQVGYHPDDQKLNHEVIATVENIDFLANTVDLHYQEGDKKVEVKGVSAAAVRLIAQIPKSARAEVRSKELFGYLEGEPDEVVVPITQILDTELEIAHDKRGEREIKVLELGAREGRSQEVFVDFLQVEGYERAVATGVEQYRYTAEGGRQRGRNVKWGYVETDGQIVVPLLRQYGGYRPISGLEPGSFDIVKITAVDIDRKNDDPNFIRWLKAAQIYRNRTSLIFFQLWKPDSKVRAKMPIEQRFQLESSALQNSIKRVPTIRVQQFTEKSSPMPLVPNNDLVGPLILMKNSPFKAQYVPSRAEVRGSSKRLMTFDVSDQRHFNDWGVAQEGQFDARLEQYGFQPQVRDFFSRVFSDTTINAYNALVIRNAQNTQNPDPDIRVLFLLLPNGIFRFTVADDGAGIRRDVLEKLLEEPVTTKDELNIQAVHYKTPIFIGARGHGIYINVSQELSRKTQIYKEPQVVIRTKNDEKESAYQKIWSPELRDDPLTHIHDHLNVGTNFTIDLTFQNFWMPKIEHDDKPLTLFEASWPDRRAEIREDVTTVEVIAESQPGSLQTIRNVVRKVDGRLSAAQIRVIEDLTDYVVEQDLLRQAELNALLIKLAPELFTPVVSLNDAIYELRNSEKVQSEPFRVVLGLHENVHAGRDPTLRAFIDVLTHNPTIHGHLQLSHASPEQVNQIKRMVRRRVLKQRADLGIASRGFNLTIESGVQVQSKYLGSEVSKLLVFTSNREVIEGLAATLKQRTSALLVHNNVTREEERSAFLAAVDKLVGESSFTSHIHGARSILNWNKQFKITRIRDSLQAQAA